LSHTPLYKGTKEVGNIKFVETKENWNILLLFFHYFIISISVNNVTL
jgi:hypothetical protein